MDHDKQVTDLVQQGTRDRFLNQPLHRDDREGDSFNLESEFAKSAKNKSILIPVAVAAFLALLGVGAWIASQFTEQASQKSTVSIGSFEDLKLKEIFDTARKNKKDLEDVQSQMDLLRPRFGDEGRHPAAGGRFPRRHRVGERRVRGPGPEHPRRDQPPGRR